MKTILHLSCDFPDPVVGAKTRAVSNLVEATPGFRHVVYSLNRANWRSGIVSLPFGADRTAVAYGAPPKGLLFESRLARLARWIGQDIAAKGIAPDLVHAHKLSVEGLIALDLFRDLGLPYIANIWGNTDLKFLTARPDLRKRWDAVMANAARLLPAAPWTEERFARDFGLDRGKSELILPIANHEASMAPTPSESPRFVTIFHLDGYRHKNLKGLIRAVAEAHRIDGRITLDVFGAGGALALCDIDAMIEAADARGFVHLKGPLQWGENTAEMLNAYTAFVMPTLRDTFGMVFVEALFCGLPILYTRNWGVDGLYPAEQVGYAWDGKSDGDLTRGLMHLIEDERAIKNSIARMTREGAFDRLKRDAIVARYTRVLDTAMARSREARANAAA